MRWYSAAGCAALMIVAAVVSLRAENADSCAWITLRGRAAVSDSVNQAVRTADALAAAGLYAEAVDILREHASARVDTAAALSTALSAQTRTKWRISSGVDYYRLQDVDTSAMTPQELRDYRRLTETPLSIWLRAKSTITPAVAGIEEIVPELYVSDRRGGVETAVHFSSPGGLLRLEPAAKAQKWFRADASADSPFEPTAGQPSDMAGASLQLTAGNAPNSARLIWVVPIAVDGEHFRADRPGYESFVEYRMFPSLEMQAHALPVRCRLSAQAEYENYYRGVSDTLDVVRFSGRAEAHVRAPAMTAFMSGAWMGDRYTNASSPEAIDRFEGGVRTEYKAAKYVTGRFRLRGIHERERYGSVDGSTVVSIKGSELTVEPAVEIGIGERLKFVPGLLGEQRWAHTKNGICVWEARSVWEPVLRIGWSSAVLEASVRGAFRAENIDVDFENYTADSRSLRAGGDVSFMPRRSLSINLSADYQYRVYAPYENRPRVSENMSIAGNVSVVR